MDRREDQFDGPFRRAKPSASSGLARPSPQTVMIRARVRGRGRVAGSTSWPSEMTACQLGQKREVRPNRWPLDGDRACQPRTASIPHSRVEKPRQRNLQLTIGKEEHRLGLSTRSARLRNHRLRPGTRRERASVTRSKRSPPSLRRPRPPHGARPLCPLHQSGNGAGICCAPRRASSSCCGIGQETAGRGESRVSGPTRRVLVGPTRWEAPHRADPEIAEEGRVIWSSTTSGQRAPTTSSVPAASVFRSSSRAPWLARHVHLRLV